MRLPVHSYQEDARDAMLAVDALEYEVARAASTASLLRAETDGVRSAADDWETLKHIAHRWKDHPDYRVKFAFFPRHIAGPTQ
ncbi:hypothetical protein RI578_38310 [Streptomyces sp. BB1-1-1]|uniref:hypothetical protein n=1 Tax=Streptomyces sp. BB1-1-1 TaxID=3074430 RepID=UPI002877D54A|nr:hypothetical protein [Streptomyces sp. BB1-1-1]WND39791.1 hypothetical protein RI578_38310 [Streptomyces sp. BB1-1-1]